MTWNILSPTLKTIIHTFISDQHVNRILSVPFLRLYVNSSCTHSYSCLCLRVTLRLGRVFLRNVESNLPPFYFNSVEMYKILHITIVFGVTPFRIIKDRYCIPKWWRTSVTKDLTNETPSPSNCVSCCRV